MATYQDSRRRPPPRAQPLPRHQIHRHRSELQHRVTRWLDLPMSVLSLIMLGLLIADYGLSLTPAWSNRVHEAENAIWVIFAVDFTVELALAPSKLRYLKRNWPTAIAVVLPMFGAVRVLRAAQLLRGLSLVRLLLIFNRGSRALGRIARRGELGYVLALTILVALCGGAGAFYFEHGQPSAQLNSIWNAIWWSSTLITTINSGYNVQTPEARIIGILLRLFALAVTGYVTALLAAYLIGRDMPAAQPAPSGEDELARLRAEVEEMKGLLQQLVEREDRAPARLDDDLVTQRRPRTGRPQNSRL